MFVILETLDLGEAPSAILAELSFAPQLSCPSIDLAPFSEAVEVANNWRAIKTAKQRTSTW